jgi:hypothetical protein
VESLRSTPLGLLVGLLIVGVAVPCPAQTVIRDSAAPPGTSTGIYRPPVADTTRARRDSSARRGARPDSAAKPAAAAPAPPPPPPPPAPPPAPAPVPTAELLPKGVCTDPAGGVAADVVLVTFTRRAQPADRDAALKLVHGTLVAPDPTDPASAYVRVPSDGNEFVLRAIADRLIRVPVVKEVGPVNCPPAP